ncbi:MAG: KH domain-containing protein [bacterium]
MFTKIKNNLIAWLLKNLEGETFYTEEQIKAINKFKSCFRIFFEGCNYDYIEQIYDNYVPIRNFEITNFKFYFEENKMFVTITLERPGLLIGKGGHTIDSLKNYINDVFKDKFKKVELNIQESKLWSNISINNF